MWYDLALGRGPGAKTASLGPGMEVDITFFGRNLLNYSFHAHLPLELLPEEDEGCMRVCIQVISLCAIVVGEEDEAFIVHSFEQHYAGVRLILGIYGGKSHGVDFMNFCDLSLHKPFSEKGDGVVADGFFVKSGLQVVLPYCSNI